MGRLEEATQAYKQSIELCEMIVDEFPSQFFDMWALADRLIRLGLVLLRSDCIDKAEDPCRRALERGETLLVENPTQTDYNLAPGMFLNKLVSLLQMQGKDEQACQLLEKYIGRQQVAPEANYPPFYSRRFVRNSYINLARTQRLLDETEKAEESLRQAIELCQELVQESPETPTDEYWLAYCLRQLGTLLRDTDWLEDAEKYDLQATNINEKVVADLPSDPRYRHYFLAIASNLRGQAWFFATCADPNYRDPTRAVELAEEAVEMTSEDASYWNTLGVAYYRAGRLEDEIEALQKSTELSAGGSSNDFFFLAMARWQLGEKERAHQWYDKAVDWMEQNQPDNCELRRFRVETEALLGISDAPTPNGKEVVPVENK